MVVLAGTYCSRDDVAGAADVKLSARMDDAVDRAAAAGTAAVDGLCLRTFLPTVATRYFDWPGYQGEPSWRLWLDGDELISADSITSGGAALSAVDYYLEPSRSGPPFGWVEINRGSSASFSSVSTPQRAITITGTWGYRDATTLLGELEGSITAGSATATLAAGAHAGPGNLLLVGTERLLITDRTFIDTGATVSGSLTASAAGTTVAVSSGTGFTTGEVVIVNSERMRVVDVVGSTLTVARAVDGTVLATHSNGAAVYAGRRLAVQRGYGGTTAAAHSDAAAVYRCDVPGLVHQLALAEALNALRQESSSWAPASGGGQSRQSRDVAGQLDMLRGQTRRLYGRRARVGAV